MILIIAAANDAHVPYVTRKLDAHAADYCQFDPQQFPAAAQVSLAYGSDGKAHKWLTVGQRRLDLDEVSAVWNRARVRPVAAAKVAPDQTWWIEETCTRFLSELYECLDCLWLPERPSSEREPFRAFNPADRTRGANPHRAQQPSPHNKLHQLALAGRLGFTIPRTLVTNDPQQLLAFFETCGGQIISKKAIPLATYRHGERTQSYTQSVHRRDLANFRAVGLAPVVFQEKVAKRLELRVTIVGDQVFAAEINSPDHFRLGTDWRHYPEFGGEGFYAIHSLPAGVSHRCVELCRHLGLCYGAIDLILTPEGDYVFLEINPGGQWGWIEDYTGLPISEAVAGLLMQAAARRVEA